MNLTTNPIDDFIEDHLEVKEQQISKSYDQFKQWYRINYPHRLIPTKLEFRTHLEIYE